MDGCIGFFTHSSISKYVIQDGGKALFPFFQQYKYHAATHVQAFMQFLRASYIVHEDIRMRLFLLSLHLEDNFSVKNWYEVFPRKIFSSLKKFIDAFSMDWDYGIKEQERKAMIDSIREETLGSSQIEEDSSKGIKDDIPFEFKDPDNPTTTKMEIGFSRLDLSGFLVYPYELQ